MKEPRYTPEELDKYPCQRRRHLAMMQGCNQENRDKLTSLVLRYNEKQKEVDMSDDGYNHLRQAFLLSDIMEKNAIVEMSNVSLERALGNCKDCAREKGFTS